MTDDDTVVLWPLCAECGAPYDPEEVPDIEGFCGAECYGTYWDGVNAARQAEEEKGPTG